MAPVGYCDDVDKLPEPLKEVGFGDVDAADTEATEREDTEATDADETKEPVDMVASTELGKAVSENMHRVVWVRMRVGGHILSDELLTDTSKHWLAGLAIVHKSRRRDDNKVEWE